MYTFDKNDIGILIAVLALIYTIYYNKTKEKRESIKDKKQFLKKLVLFIKNINFQDSEENKEKNLDDFRDELNFCELFNDNQKAYMVFCEKLDDDFYVLTVTMCNENFKEMQNILLTSIRNFNV